MFNKTLAKTSTLDRAVIASIAAMLAFNAAVLTHQAQPSPLFAQTQGEAAKQA
jgi:hypothetical protein